MTVKPVRMERFSVTSAKSFEEVVAVIEAAVGHPDMPEFRRKVASAKTFAELEKIIHRVIGVSGFMEFARFDLGEIVRKERGTAAPQSLRLLIGNPLIMKQMIEPVPDAGSYAPVTILIDVRVDGVHLSYDRMASLLSPCGSAAAMKVARDLDAKVEALLTAAAA
jgi:uncharacterized protein (DUF302 family)